MNNDLISRNETLRMLKFNKYNWYGIGSMEDIDKVMQDIKNLPAVDAEPVRRGRWLSKEVEAVTTKFECSECGRTVMCGNDYFGKATKHISSYYPYCHCGAKMDLEVQDGKNNEE